jgi:hypothetical protein
LRFAGRAKGAARLVDGKIQWEPINADVEKRSDAGPDNEGEDAEQEVVGHCRNRESPKAFKKE